jgi:hypothetical protein
MSEGFDRLEGFNNRPDINKSIHDHLYDDLDNSPDAHHHSLGFSPNQAVSYPLAKERFDDLYAAPWQDYVPTFTGWTGGTYTRSGRFTKRGTTIDYWASVEILTMPSVIDTPVIGLPEAGHNPNYGTHNARILDLGSANYLAVSIADVTNPWVSLFRVSLATTAYALITSTAPHTWAVGDIMFINGSYETAA